MKNCCRCCLGEECTKDMNNEYFWDEKTEVYSELLYETFNIRISKYQEKSLICEECIVKLRDAATFKKKVLEAENRFIKFTEFKSGNTTDATVKLETESLKDEFSDFDDHVNDFSETDFMCDHQKESTEQIFVIKLEDKKDNTKEMPKTLSLINKYVRMYGEPRENAKNISKPQTLADLLSTTPNHPKEKKVTTKTTVKSSETKPERSVSEEQRMRCENTIKLIQNSNLCLFRSMRTKYGCYFCQNTFVDPKELREHIYRSHLSWKALAVRHIEQMRGSTYKNADISELKCTECSETCTDLVDLREHLKKHNIHLSNSESFLIPYRLSEGYVCVQCNQKYQSFTRLSMHMHSHYSHHVCEICGSSYINMISLRTHINAVHKERKCAQCPAIFVTFNEKTKHMTKYHNVRRNYKRYCNLCDKTFRYTYMLQEHKIQEHNAHRPPTNCNECGKTFARQNQLKIHVRSVHKKERNYPCTVCGMGFFTSTDQKRHERTHVDIRSFSCNYCDSKFKSKESCRRHLKRLHGHLFE